MESVLIMTHLGCLSTVMTSEMNADSTLLMCAPSGHRMKHWHLVNVHGGIFQVKYSNQCNFNRMIILPSLQNSPLTRYSLLDLRKIDFTSGGCSWLYTLEDVLLLLP